MKLKGDLESIGVAELFKTLAEQRATGLLSVNSPMGEKTIALAQGEVAVCADNLTERTRLGDLLVARGKVTDEQLGQALKAQKQDPRTKLGDVLIKQGSVTPELIAEALRFQVEEQILDLFTWREAAFEFDSDRSVEELDELNGGHTIQRLNVGTQALMADAAKRMENWKQIVDRIPTPYLCFKIAPKGEENIGKAPRNTQAIVKLLKEGRTLETTVKKSCLGRFNVYTAVIKLLDDGWIFPIPANELRFLASEHKFKRRFLDCLYIYRRLLETSQSETDRAEFQKQIQDTIDAIHSASASGEAGEGIEIVSYKEAADRFRKRKLRRRVVFGVFIFASLFMIVFLLLKEMAPKQSLPDEYQKCIKKSDELVAGHKFDDAVKVWHDFFVSIPDKGGYLADYVRHRETAVIEAQRSYYDSLLTSAKNAEKAKKFAEAEKIYQVILDEFKKPDETDPAREGLLRIKQFKENAQAVVEAETLQERCKAALDLFKDKKYALARVDLKKLADELPVTAEFRTAVDAALKDIDEIEQRATAAATRAAQELENKHGEKAIDLYEKVYSEWTDVPGADKARNELSKLRLNQRKLQDVLAEARKMDDVYTAVEILTKAARDFDEFDQCGDVRTLLAEKKAKLAAIDKMLNEAQDAVKAGDKKKARGLFAELLKDNGAYLSIKGIKIPVPVTSIPDKATVKLDGQDVGVTNCEVDFPVEKAFTLHFELEGYEWFDMPIDKLRSDYLIVDAQGRLGFQYTLKRSAKKKRKFAGGIFAPPVVIDGKLYVFHGDSLAILDPEGKQDKPSDAAGLFNPEAESRPDPHGGPDTKMDKDDKEQMKWWLPRSAPEAFGKGKVLLLLRSRDIVELDVTDPLLKPKTLFSLQFEPMGRPYIDLESYQGFPLVAVGCADGKIYVYNLKTGQLDKNPIDADPRAGKRNVEVVTLTTRTDHQFISLSNTGYLRCFNSYDLKNEVWHYELETDLGGVINDLPIGKENLAAFTLKNGKAVVINLDTPKKEKKEWELTAKPAEEYTHAVVSPDGIYVFNRKRDISKYEREAVQREAKSSWGPHRLDGGSDLPLVAIPKIGVFICTDAGTISGFKANRGEKSNGGDKIFDIQTNNLPDKPTVLSAAGDLLYLGFPKGDMWILSTSDR